MSAMTAVLIDPYLVAFRDKFNTAAELEEFADAVLAWNDAFASSDLDISMSLRCLEALIADSHYPYEHRLRQLIWELKVVAIDTETFCRAVQLVFERTPYFEEGRGIVDILVDPPPTIEPPDASSRLTPTVASAFSQSLSIFGMWQSIHQGAARGIIATSRNPSGELGTNPIRVIARIIDAQSSYCELPYPLEIQEEFEVYERYASVFLDSDVLDIWGDGSSHDKIVSAIHHSITKITNSMGTDMNSASAFRLGDRFIQSLHDWKVNAQPSLIRILVETCARICLGVPKNEVTAFRGEPTRDDGANAFRTHLTKRGIAYRLMLWELPDKTYEFANVGGKSELIIY